MVGIQRSQRSSGGHGSTLRCYQRYSGKSPNGGYNGEIIHMIWEFQDPKMEVLYHIYIYKAIFGGDMVGISILYRILKF